VLGFTTIGDRYLDASKVANQYEMKFGIGKNNKSAFINSGNQPTSVGLPYEYKSDSKTLIRKAVKDPSTQKVLTQPPNVLTSPTIHNYSLHYPHLQDEYDRQRLQKLKEIQLN
jgi:hypothetical protein